MDSTALTPTAQRWAALVAELERSPLSLSAFARRHGVHPSTLSSWRSRLASASRSSFVDVTPARTPAPVLELELPDFGVRVPVPVGTDLAWLRTVLEALA
jgi:transposase-like protein